MNNLPKIIIKKKKKLFPCSGKRLFFLHSTVKLKDKSLFEVQQIELSIERTCE